MLRPSGSTHTRVAAPSHNWKPHTLPRAAAEVNLTEAGIITRVVPADQARNLGTTTREANTQDRQLIQGITQEEGPLLEPMQTADEEGLPMGRAAEGGTTYTTPLPPQATMLIGIGTKREIGSLMIKEMKRMTADTINLEIAGATRVPTTSPRLSPLASQADLQVQLQVILLL